MSVARTAFKKVEQDDLDGEGITKDALAMVSG